MNQNQSIDWYFDFISPFAYLQHVLLLREQEKNPALSIRYRPVLFAGMLGHHGHKGPAEIPEKRLMTYRFCHWLAEQHDVAFAMPAAHPFNPLPMLRSAIALDCEPAIVTTLFAHCWVNSALNSEFATLDAIAALPGLADAAAHYTDTEVKTRLRRNTEQALDRGLFGVPTIAIDDDLFWGVDMTAMALARLRDPALLDGAEYQRIDALPAGAKR